MLTASKNFCDIEGAHSLIGKRGEIRENPIYCYPIVRNLLRFKRCHKLKLLVDRVGVEPTTYRLKGEYSAS